MFIDVSRKFCEIINYFWKFRDLFENYIIIYNCDTKFIYFFLFCITVVIFVFFKYHSLIKSTNQFDNDFILTLKYNA